MHLSFSFSLQSLGHTATPKIEKMRLFFGKLKIFRDSVFHKDTKELSCACSSCVSWYINFLFYFFYHVLFFFVVLYSFILFYYSFFSNLFIFDIGNHLHIIFLFFTSQNMSILINNSKENSPLLVRSILYDFHINYILYFFI